jgi:hypothetical protein
MCDGTAGRRSRLPQDAEACDVVRAEENAMGAKAMAVGGLILLLAVSGLVDRSFAAPFPSYFEDEWVGILCLRGTVPGGGGPVNVLVQLNFDKSTNGGITLPEANQQFNALKSQLTFAGALVTQICAIPPGQIQSDLGINGLQAAQQLAGQFHQLGFALYFIADTFWNIPLDYLELPEGALVLRTDVFGVNGPNNISYTRSTETLDSLVP